MLLNLIFQLCFCKSSMSFFPSTFCGSGNESCSPLGRYEERRHASLLDARRKGKGGNGGRVSNLSLEGQDKQEEKVFFIFLPSPIKAFPPTDNFPHLLGGEEVKKLGFRRELHFDDLLLRRAGVLPTRRKPSGNLLQQHEEYTHFFPPFEGAFLRK